MPTVRIKPVKKSALWQIIRMNVVDQKIFTEGKLNDVDVIRHILLSIFLNTFYIT